MIKSLRIKNLATIEDLELNFHSGFNILTGETGAGKSIIIDSIKLVLGEKGAPDLIRTGKSEAWIEAIFELPQEKVSKKELSLPLESEVLVQRQISEQGGKAYVDGVLVPLKKLKEILPFLVDIYGQNDHIFLLHTENHLNYLDSYIDVPFLKDDVQSTAQKLKKLLREKKELEQKEKERNLRLDYLDFQIKEIEQANLKSGEDAELLQERAILKNAEKINQLVEKAHGISYLDENSVLTLTSKLLPLVKELSLYDKSFQAFSREIDDFTISIREFSNLLVNFQEKRASSPERLEELESRLSLLEKLKKKYGRTLEDILNYLEAIKREYQELAQAQEKMADLDQDIQSLFQAYKNKVEKLSELRREGALRLEKEVERELTLLGMKKTQFRIKIEQASLEEGPIEIEKIKENGLEEVEFLLSPNPGEELRPLRKIASGGELSRVMLALKSIGKEKERLKTLIFDEIDSGIGGRTAECIAQRLRALAKHHQIICITHLPQIASFAPYHYRVDKKIEKQRTFTICDELSFEERVQEVARLLSGSHVTETSLQNAKEMLLHNLKELDMATSEGNT